jgi:hypothetical protein
MFFSFHDQRREVRTSAAVEFEVTKVGNPELIPGHLVDAVVADDEDEPGFLTARYGLDLKREPLQKSVIDPA